MKRIVTLLLALALLLSLGSAFALTPGEQLDAVYESFGVRRGDVPELKITSDEEKQLLSGLVDASVIGTKSVSCIYIELLDKGSGLDLRTHNITWCTKEMFLTALTTAGISDARVIVSAPYASAGTAGIYKAWEALSGEKLDETAKAAGTQELAAAASLSEKIGSEEALQIIAELKKLVGSEPALDGEALTEKIGDIAADLNIRLPEGGSEELSALFATLKKLDPKELRGKAEPPRKCCSASAAPRKKPAASWRRCAAYSVQFPHFSTPFLANESPAA